MDDQQIKDAVRYNLKRLREEKGITQEDVAKVVGKSTHAISSWEQGLSNPDIAMLYRLAKYYNKTIDAMYGNIDMGEE